MTNEAKRAAAAAAKWDMPTTTALATLAELDLLSRCDAFVGTFSSSFSRLAYLLMVGRRGGLAPYISLDGVTWAQEETHR